MRLIAYLRTSTNGEANGDSLAAQLDACQAWAESERHTIVSTREDAGLSGKLDVDRRPGLLDAVEMVEAGEADGLVVHRLDRLGRELHVQEAILGRVWAAGGSTFEAVEGEVARDDPDDTMRSAMRQMAGVFAQLERGMIAVRLSGGRRRKRERGGYSGGPTVPFGWKVEGEGREARFVPDPETAPTVETIRELRRSGLTLQAIAQRLNEDGVASPAGARWHVNSVRRVLARAE
jgi:DNA invertase Pin-like site-specific DNA recombinase